MRGVGPLTKKKYEGSGEFVIILTLKQLHSIVLTGLRPERYLYSLFYCLSSSTPVG